MSVLSDGKKAKFCKDSCPVCRRARKRKGGFLYYFVKLERKLCPFCRAYERVYGKPAHE